MLIEGNTLVTGFRALKSCELEEVCGGRGGVNLNLQVDVNRLIDQAASVCSSSACLEDSVNGVVNDAIDLGAKTTTIGTDPNGVEIKLLSGTDYIIKDTDGNGEYDQIWQNVGGDPMFPDYRMFDGQTWRTTELRPWDNTPGGTGMKSIFTDSNSLDSALSA